MTISFEFHYWYRHWFHHTFVGPISGLASVAPVRLVVMSSWTRTRTAMWWTNVLQPWCSCVFRAAPIRRAGKVFSFLSLSCSGSHPKGFPRPSCVENPTPFCSWATLQAATWYDGFSRLTQFCSGFDFSPRSTLELLLSFVSYTKSSTYSSWYSENFSCLSHSMVIKFEGAFLG